MMSGKFLLDQNRTPLFDAVRKFSDWNTVPFFVPSHKMGKGIDPRFKAFAGENIFKMDLSEVRWTDDFHNASSSIKEALELAADAWGAEKTHFLVNGTSGGIIAAICSVCSDGDTIILPRNVHKSAIYGLVLSGAKPVYIEPEQDIDLGIIGGIAYESLERAFEQCPDAKAVVVVSPTYHGVMSDMKVLSDIAHHHKAVLIADEAHGSHLYFSERLPKGALELGADIVCQSTHKMSGSLTQSSILHLGRAAKRRVDFEKVQANLSMVQTTSPSYILLASIDLARSFIAMQGETILSSVLDDLEIARKGILALPGMEVLGNEIVGSTGIADYEPTRLVISTRSLGLEGDKLFNILRERYSIECEFADSNWCVCVAGLGTMSEHTKQLMSALADVSNCFSHCSNDGTGCLGNLLPPVPPLGLTPREAWFAQKEEVQFEAACGRISAGMVVPYPPGIPVLCPGEVITEEVWCYLAELKQTGQHIHANAGEGLKTLSVIK